MNQELDSEQEFAMYIATVVRNHMEAFHVKHLTDTQMAELNPLIRDAVYTALHAASEAERNEWARKWVEGTYQMIPRYWEPPKLIEDYTYMASGRWEEDFRKLASGITGDQSTTSNLQSG